MHSEQLWDAFHCFHCASLDVRMLFLVSFVPLLIGTIHFHGITQYPLNIEFNSHCDDS